MLLRGKVISLILFAFVVLGAIYYAVQQLLILPSFITLEREESNKDMGRAVLAIQREAEHLDSSAADWAFWDDTYLFALDGNAEFRKENLNKESLAGLKVNLLYLFDERGKPLWGMVYDLINQQEIAVEGLEQQLSAIHLSGPDESVGGELLTARGPVIIVARPILQSNAQGPARGHLVVGRFLDAGAISEQARISLQVTMLGGTMSSEITAIVEQTAGMQEPFIRREKEVNRVYRVLPDIFDKPALLLEVVVPRSISARGQKALFFALASLLGAGFIIILLLIGIMEKTILRPLRQLADHAAMIGEQNDLGVRLAEDRKDEIGILNTKFNTMIEQLSCARKSFMDQSYQSGRAEVARNILHSVGNALNGVVTSSILLLEKTQKSCSGDVIKVADLLREQGDGLGRFLTNDSRGKMIPAYLASVGAALEEERRFVLQEAGAMQDKIRGIKEIIARQRSFSQQSRLLESERVEELLEAAIQLSIDQQANSAVSIRREYQTVSVVSVDRHKVLQILLHLINNARSACMKSDRQDKKIVLRIFSSRPDAVVIQIADNGIGLSPGQLASVFQSDSSSKETQQGFGLHYSSLAAKELGGKLTVESDGTGRGATCTLELPCTASGTK